MCDRLFRTSWTPQDITHYQTKQKQKLRSVLCVSKCTWGRSSSCEDHDVLVRVTLYSLVNFKLFFIVSRCCFLVTFSVHLGQMSQSLSVGLSKQPTLNSIVQVCLRVSASLILTFSTFFSFILSSVSFCGGSGSWTED